MRIDRVQATDLLGLSRLDLALPDSYTTLTGANGVGKTTVLTACAIARATVDETRWQLEQTEWMSAGHRGSDSFEIRMGIEFDKAWEQDTIDAFFRAACLRLLHLEGPEGHRTVDAALDQWDRRPAEPMYRGELVANFDNGRRDKWHAGWEFDLAGNKAVATLLGPRMSSLRSGPLEQEGAVRWLSELAVSTNNIPEMVSSGQVRLGLSDTLLGQGYDFVVESANLTHEPTDIAFIVDLISLPNGKRVGFRDVLHRLFNEQLVITPNRRFTAKTIFKIGEMRGPLDLSDGTNVAGELHRLKNGTGAEVARFVESQRIFQRLTGKAFDVTQNVIDVRGDEQPSLRIKPVQRGGGPDSFGHEIPISRLGAGAEEALFSATVLSSPGRVLLIDEPGVHTSPTGLRRLKAALDNHSASGQVVVVTHSPDLVPSGHLEDLRHVVRLASEPMNVVAHRINPDLLAGSGMLRHVASPVIRSLLFASGVLLCEGDSDVSLLQAWVEQGLGEGLPTSTEANVSIIAVGGEADFASAIKFAEGFGIPWSAVTDGPALAPKSMLWKFLSPRGAFPDPGTIDFGSDFQAIADLWADLHVHTLATTFGKGTEKGRGEIEAFMEALDPVALQSARTAAGRPKGLAVSARFAEIVPAPGVVKVLWRSVLRDLGLLS